MARHADTYRAARKRIAKEQGVPFVRFTVIKQDKKDGSPPKSIVVTMPPPIYRPVQPRGRYYDPKKASLAGWGQGPTYHGYQKAVAGGGGLEGSHLK